MKPFDTAKAAVKETPEESNRAIARRIGVADTTVGRARRELITAGELVEPAGAPEGAAYWDELQERARRSVPWPDGADARPVHPDGEIATRQLRDAIVRLRNVEPQISELSLGIAMRDVFADTKKLHFTNLTTPGVIDPVVKKWSGDVNLKVRARELILERVQRRRWDVETDEHNRRYLRRAKQGKIHGFGAAWARFERALNAALKKSVFSFEDEQALKEATVECLSIYFETLRQKVAKPARVNSDGDGQFANYKNHENQK